MSITKTLENQGLLTSKKAIKKPNGKGYSVGNVGEERIISPVNLSKNSGLPAQSSEHRSDDEDVPDFEDIPDLVHVDEATKLSHPGITGRISASSSSRGHVRGRGIYRGRGQGQGKRPSNAFSRKSKSAKKSEDFR